MNGKDLLLTEILISSTNEGKIREIKEILGTNFVSLKDKGFKDLKVLEDGNNFKENAYKKSKAYALKYDMVAVSDDSGLEIKALNGKPGVNSARYAGINTSDSDLYLKVLKEMEHISERDARFVTVICLYNPFNNNVIYAEGVCEGLISFTPKGKNGFGYDPIFFIPNLNKTMAELSLYEKNQISHRAKALINLKNILKNT